MKSPKNMAISVRQRLKNKMLENNRPFNELLQHYAMERFLFRLSQSKYADRFILKGALMLQAWKSPRIRPTMDIDMLGRTSNEESNLGNIIKNILAIQVIDDGLTFHPETITTERIKEDADYHGIRILLQGNLDTARVRIQVDVGFNDVVYPKPEIIDYPVLLDFPAPKLLGYSRESTIAEKFEAIVSLGNQNSRMKDFYDIWLLSNQFNFNGTQLGEAIRRTFTHRETPFDDEILAFSEDFPSMKQIQWSAFERKMKSEYIPKSLKDIIIAVQTFINPIVDGLINESPMPSQWAAPGPWK